MAASAGIPVNPANRRMSSVGVKCHLQPKWNSLTSKQALPRKDLKVPAL